MKTFETEGKNPTQIILELQFLKWSNCSIGTRWPSMYLLYVRNYSPEKWNFIQKYGSIKICRYKVQNVHDELGAIQRTTMTLF